MNKWPTLVVLLALVVFLGIYFRNQAEKTQTAETDGTTEVDATADTAVDTSASAEEAASTDAATTADTTSECPVPTATGSGDNHAGLLITFGGGVSQSFCVAFEERTITGEQLLERAGATLVAEEYPGLGLALCKITSGRQADGCDYPSEKCFCDSPPNSWGFYVAEGTQWNRSQTGFAVTSVGNGGAQAQTWGDENVVPPSCFYDDLCPAASE